MFFLYIKKKKKKKKKNSAKTRKKQTIVEYVATSGATPQTYTQAHIFYYILFFNQQNRKCMEHNIKCEQLTLIQNISPSQDENLKLKPESHAVTLLANLAFN